MTKSEINAIIAHLRTGGTIGIFENPERKQTVWRMVKTWAGNIDICHYGGYCIRCNVAALRDWLKWSDHYKLTLAPVKLCPDYVHYERRSTQ